MEAGVLGDLTESPGQERGTLGRDDIAKDRKELVGQQTGALGRLELCAIQLNQCGRHVHRKRHSGFMPICLMMSFCSAVHVPDISPCCMSSFLFAYMSFVVWNSFTLA